MFNKILIIGCGLIGSSIVRSIYSTRRAKNIYILEKSKKNIKILKNLKMNLKFVESVSKININFDLIVFCTPISQYKSILTKINRFIGRNTIITDVGSTKELAGKNVKKLLKNKSQWVASHPIAGSEVSGPQHGDKSLFKNKWCVLIKDKETNKKNLNKIKLFWKKMGSNVVLMNSKQHDYIFSITSHLPHLIAYNLVKTATDIEKEKKYDLIKYSAGGLRDFSRIAASNEIMWRDIFFSNNKNISSVIDKFIKNLRSFQKDILKKNDKLTNKLINTKKVRRKIVSLKQDTNKPNFGRVN